MPSFSIPTSFFSFDLEHHHGDCRKKKMKMRNKNRIPTSISCNEGSKCSLSAVVCCLVGCITMIYLYSLIFHNGENLVNLNYLQITRELEEVENFTIPSPSGKLSPHATKWKVKPPSLVDDLFNNSSQIKLLFFPDQRTAIDPDKAAGKDRMYFYPGRQWFDTDGNPIQAHGGGILYVERVGRYYWYGENKDGPTYSTYKKRATRVDIIGVSCYSSKDLWTWKNEGIVLRGEESNITHDLHKSNVLERPKVIYNDKTGLYIMWMHIDNFNYTKASVGVAISKWPTGPFEYLYSKRPHGFDSRDMTIFKDEDGKAYLFYSSSNNRDLHVSPLTDDYLDVTRVMRRILVGKRREAPAVFKHQGTYYMITSGCSGWAPNTASVHAAVSIMGPWETMGNPCIGGNYFFQSTTFLSQSTFVLPLPGMPDTFVFMADRWNPAELRDSRYVWLPLGIGGVVDEPLEYSFGFPLWSRVSIYWHRRWRLPDGWKGAKTWLMALKRIQ